MRITVAVSIVGILLCDPAGADAQDHVRGVESKTVDVSNPKGPVQKLLVTRPVDTRRKLSAILILPWMDCSSLALPAEKLHGFQQVMQHLVAASGMVVGRIEKPGIGGSGGVCGDTDFETELEGYRAAPRQLEKDDWTGDKVILVGQSFSGGVLPLVSQGRPVSGYVVIGSWVRTWFERLIEFERNQMLRAGTPPAELAARMRAFTSLYSTYLNDRVTPAQAIGDRPALKAVWTGVGTHQYGRPAAFFHQLQALDLETAWSAVGVPTLLLWGDRDIAMHRSDHERIAELVNRKQPAAATFKIIAGGDHTLLVGPKLGPDVIPTLDQWLRQFVSK